jgi:hypothetical protein
MMAQDNLAADGEPQACPLLYAFGGKEWVKDVGQIL